MCVCVCVCVVRCYSLVGYLEIKSVIESDHPEPIMVASSSHSDSKLWHNFGQETYTQLLLLNRNINEYLVFGQDH